MRMHVSWNRRANVAVRVRMRIAVVMVMRMAMHVRVTGRVRVPDDALATDGARRARASRDRAKGVGPPKRKPGRAKRPA